jgi:choline transporter-like protein 2/4/5
MTSDPTHFAGYKQRHCTDVLCLILFIIFIVIYGFISILAISQGNPTSLIQPSDSLGNLCGQDEFTSQPYQLYFDISKCLTDGGLSFVCPTTKLCVSSCPTVYSDYQSLQTIETAGYLPRSFTRQQLICMVLIQY